MMCRPTQQAATESLLLKGAGLKPELAPRRRAENFAERGCALTSTVRCQRNREVFRVGLKIHFLERRFFKQQQLRLGRGHPEWKQLERCHRLQSRAGLEYNAEAERPKVSMTFQVSMKLCLLAVVSHQWKDEKRLVLRLSALPEG